MKKITLAILALAMLCTATAYAEEWYEGLESTSIDYAPTENTQVNRELLSSDIQRELAQHTNYATVKGQVGDSKAGTFSNYRR